MPLKNNSSDNVVIKWNGVRYEIKPNKSFSFSGSDQAKVEHLMSGKHGLEHIKDMNKSVSEVIQEVKQEIVEEKKLKKVRKENAV